ncbi:putative FMN-binding regulatory protein PaiB [Nocardia sp. GAS34]|uniref:hypothetical protein n=1 Tax=unclassified Nocardia TaxID=2637762 RepID=UPI003D22C654
MITALIAGFAGLFGIAVGRFWDSRAEESRWRRDQRAAAYLGVAKAFWDVFRVQAALAATELPDATDDPRNWSRSSEAAASALDQWNDAFLAVLVYGAPRVAEAAKEVDELVDVMGTKAAGTNHDWDSWDSETMPFKGSFTAMLAEIRADLGLATHTATF